MQNGDFKVEEEVENQAEDASELSSNGQVKKHCSEL